MAGPEAHGLPAPLQPLLFKVTLVGGEQSDGCKACLLMVQPQATSITSASSSVT